MSNNKRTAAIVPTLNGPIKGPNAAASAGPNLNSVKNFVEREKQIIQLLSEHIKDHSGKRGLEQIQDELRHKEQENQDLKSQLEKLRGECEEKVSKAQTDLAEQRALVKHLHLSHEDRLREFEAKSNRDEAELEKLAKTERELQEALGKLDNLNNKKNSLKGEHSQLSNKVEQLTAKVNELKRRCEKSRLEVEELNERLEQSQTTSKQLSEDLGFLFCDREVIDEQFDALASKLHKLVWKTFCNKPLSFEEDSPSPPTINAPGPSLSAIPQLASNTLPARYMRCALVEALIAETLASLVFSNNSIAVPTLKIKSADERENLGPFVQGLKILSTFGYPLEATIIRCQLAKVCKDLHASQKIAAKATRIVWDTLQPWLVGGNGTIDETFADELSKYISEASDLWQTLQRTRYGAKAIVGNAGVEWDYLEDTWPEYSQTEKSPTSPTSGTVTGQNKNDDNGRGSSSPTAGHPATLPVATLFPQIVASVNLAVEPDEPDDRILFHGYAIFPMQPVFVAARKELAAQEDRKMRTTPPPMARRNSAFSRRRISRAEKPVAPLLRDDQGPGRGPSQQAEPARPAVETASARSGVGRRLSISSRDGAAPLQQKSTVSDSGSTISSSHRNRREERTNPTMSESSTRSRRSGSGTGGSGDGGNG